MNSQSPQKVLYNLRNMQFYNRHWLSQRWQFNVSSFQGNQPADSALTRAFNKQIDAYVLYLVLIANWFSFLSNVGLTNKKTNKQTYFHRFFQDCFYRKFKTTSFCNIADVFSVSDQFKIHYYAVLCKSLWHISIFTKENGSKTVIYIFCCVLVGNISSHFQTFLLPLIVIMQSDNR